MFRVAFMVEDKNLAKVLTNLAGLTLNMEPPQPVINATVQKGKVKETSPEGGNVTGCIRDLLKGLTKGTEISRIRLMELVKLNGGDPNSASYVATKMKDEGILTQAKRGMYTVA